MHHCNIRSLYSLADKQGLLTNHKRWTVYNVTIIICILTLAFQIISINGRIPDEPPIQPPPNILLTTPRATVTATVQSMEIESTQTNPCFYAESDLCNYPRGNDSCSDCIPHPVVQNALVCCNVTDIERSISCVPNPGSANGDTNSSYWVHLHIRNATLNELHISNKYWKRLDSLIVTDGHINRITNEFTKFSSPQCINISNNNLEVIHSRAFKDLVRLQVLDISHNNLSTIPNLNNIPTNLSLDIRGNNAILCKAVLDSIDRGGVHFVEPHATYCLTNQTFNWFNSTDSISLTQLEHIKQLKPECLYIPGYGNCTCEMDQMIYKELQFFYAAKVDCSSMRLTSLPEKLPLNTLFLNVSNNNITSLSALNDNPSYKQLLRFHADDNQITSMLDLEGSEFLQHFERLSLRRNKLKSIPMYLLSNALEKSPDGRALLLEGNQLHCDCNSAKVLKLWLLTLQMHITDYDKILCDNYKQSVVELSAIKLCQSHHDWTDYIYLLITAEVILLMALIIKISYDYWMFKTAGYLPWPANKMPKLPCDWLCES